MPAPRPVELFIPEIRSLLQGDRLEELKDLLLEINPIDLADGFPQFSVEHQHLLLRLLDPGRALEVFEELETPQQEALIGRLRDGSLPAGISGLAGESAGRLFQKIPTPVVRKMERFMKKVRIEAPRNVPHYPEGTAGALMTTEFVPADPEMTARAVLERLQASVRLLKEEYVQSLYVTAPNGKLVGGLTLKTLISSPADIKVKDIMSPVALIRIPARMDQEDAAEVFSRYKLISAPVVDDEIRLVGVLTVDDILDVVQDEATEDMAKLAGTKAEDLETGSFMRVTVLRMPWLLASYFGGILASFVIGHYQELLGRVLALATFIPVIAGMGGNVGTQSSTIVVRGLATGRIQLDRIWKVIRREFAVGLTLGLTYGCFLSAVAVARHGTAYSWRLPVVVGVGILTSMTVAAVMGTMTPVLFKKLKIDPAAVSAPFVSTATDLASIGVYLLLASKLLF